MIYKTQFVPLEFRDLYAARRANDSRRIAEIEGPAILLAGSGMCTGGRIVDHLIRYLPDRRTDVLFVGYQAEGTLGRRIQKGWREVPVGRRETIVINLEIVTIDGFSGHSDRRQLINYVGHVQPKPAKIFTIHGDANNTIDLASSLYTRYHIETHLPMNLETYRMI